MKANELRIGNQIIFSQDGTIFTVGSIEEKGFMVQNEEETTWIESEEFEPIPLTEEWLLKFGFAKQKGKIDIFEKSRLRIWIGTRGQSLCYLVEENTTSAHYIPNCLQHVHQLQNLYFALTGEELTYGGNK